MAILCIDAMNFFHRARSGWSMGPAPVVFNFMRNFRALVEQFNPTRVYFVLEGKAQQRRDLLPEYKANRAVEAESKEAKELERFFSQVNEIVSLLKENFPISVVRHPRFECDDTIYNLVKSSTPVVDWVVASNDTDFIQLLNEFDNVKLWNPMKKSFVEKPPYDYVTWKSLRGDGSDNISGIQGVGDKTASDLASNPEKLKSFLSEQSNLEIFQRNHELIKFIRWSEEEAAEMTCSMPKKDWSPLRETFEKYEFKSLLKEETWQKFVDTFEPLWG